MPLWNNRQYEERNAGRRYNALGQPVHLSGGRTFNNQYEDPVRFSQQERNLQSQRQPRLAELFQNLLGRNDSGGQQAWQTNGRTAPQAIPQPPQQAPPPMQAPPQRGAMQAAPPQATYRGRVLPNIRPGGLENGFNQQLPDGVTLQPISSDTLKNIQSSVGAPITAQTPVSPAMPAQISPPTAHSALIPPPNAKPPSPQFPAATSLQDTLFRNIIQSENNASLFYNHLAKNAPRAQFSEILQGIVTGANKRKAAYNGIYKNVSGSGFEPANVELPLGINFYEGVNMAIREESAILRSLSEIYDILSDNVDSKNINSQIISKIGDINSLHYILAQKG